MQAKAYLLTNLIYQINMLTENYVKDMVEMVVNHPKYPNSFQVVEDVLDDLERCEKDKIITPDTRKQLADMLMKSHHITGHNSSQLSQ